MTRSYQNNRLHLALNACRGSFIAAGFFSLFTNLLMLVPTFYMLQVYGRVVPSGHVTTLVMLTLILTLLLASQGVLEWMRSRIMIRVGTRLDVLVSRDLYKAGFKKALHSGGMDTSNQPLNDLTGLRQFISGNGVIAFFDAPWLPIYIAVMFLFHPWYGWAAIGCSVVLLLLAVLNEKLTADSLASANQERAEVGLATAKNMRNAESVEAMGMLDALLLRWAHGHRRVLLLQSQASDRSGVIISISKACRLWVQSLVLGLGAYLTINHEISPGVMIAGSVLLGRALSPIDLMIGSWKGFVAARGQYARLKTLFETQASVPDRMPLPAPKGNVVVENLAVGAPGQNRLIIKSIAFSAPSGSMVGIIGPSASGKSTLARALLGVWAPHHGVVRLDGADIFSWDKGELGPYLGYLPQDIELFEGTVSDNIARFGSVDPEKVVMAARTVAIHEMILALPDGYDTFIGSNGVNLSSGQKQRIALARAFYGNPRLIVLDEPNSNLDEAGERALSGALQQARKTGATVFVITHRSGVLSQLDRLLVMNAGILSLYGPRDKVLAELSAQQAARQPKIMSQSTGPRSSFGARGNSNDKS